MFTEYGYGGGVSSASGTITILLRSEDGAVAVLISSCLVRILHVDKTCCVDGSRIWNREPNRVLFFVSRLRSLVILAVFERKPALDVTMSVNKIF